MSLVDISPLREHFLDGVEWAADPIRLVVCDDHALFRRKLIIRLEDEPDLEVLGEADTGPEAMVLAEELAPDVVLVDLGLQPYGGVAATSQISRVTPTTGVVLLAVDEKEPDELLEGYGAGAVAMMLKEDALSLAPQVIRRVARREYIVPSAVAGAMGRLIDRSSRGPVEDGAPEPEVTDQERLVIEIVARGADAADAAAGLGIAPGTARNLLANVVKKLQRYWRMDDAVVSLATPREAQDRLAGVAEAARRAVAEESA